MHGVWTVGEATRATARDTTLNVRMLAIGTTFGRFRRLVRDLASELDKEVVLASDFASALLDVLDVSIVVPIRTPDGRVRYYSWDAERIFENVNANRLGVNNSATPGEVFEDLRASAEFRLKAGDHAHRHLFNGGALTPDNALSDYAGRFAKDGVFRAALEADAMLLRRGTAKGFDGFLQLVEPVERDSKTVERLAEIAAVFVDSVASSVGRRRIRNERRNRLASSAAPIA